MANVRTPVLSGITEFGEVTGATDYTGGTDVPWGATEQNGVTLNISGEDVDVQSGQALVLEDSFASSRAMEITARLQHAGLLNLQDALGMPSGTLTGDLGETTPTDEVLDISGTDIGSSTKHIYALTPGPAAARRYEAGRCKQRAGMTIELASNDYVRYETVWTVLKFDPVAGTGPDLKITDAAT